MVGNAPRERRGEGGEGVRKGGEVGNREQGKRPTRTSPYFVTPRSDCSRIKYQSHARFDEETIVDASDVGCLKLEKKKKRI